MKASLDPALTKTKLIRDVAPKKMMTLVSFRLTENMIDRHSDKRRKVDASSVCWKKKNPNCRN